MYIKIKLIGIISFLIVGGGIYLWGPGWSSGVRIALSCAMYAFAFFASFVVVRRK